MKKFLTISCPVLLLFFFSVTHAQSVSFKPSPESLNGEVIDLNIYMYEGGHGAAVQHWALDGIKNGDPIALLSDDGKIVLLLPNTIRADAYTQLRRLPGQTVSVTGQIYLRKNFIGMDVQSFQVLR